MIPYISFVVAARNDNYGDDFNYRLENSINQLANLIEQYKLPSEYIIVNYNPILDKASLIEQIKWPKSTYCKIRIITVEPEVHQTLSDENIRVNVPLYEYIAKNVGIRRAKGEFVCSANPDLMFSPQIIKYISKRKLKKESYYRANRVDFNRIEINSQNLPKTLIKDLQKNVFRVFLLGNTINIHLKKKFYIQFNLLKLLNRIYQPIRQFYREVIFHNEKIPEHYYNCNCSGDFMLLHKKKWFKLKGNPESTKAAVHTDSMFVIMAAMSGLKEKVFYWPIYHQNHDRRYECDSDNADPIIDEMYETYVKMGRQMIKEGTPIIQNNDDWGLADYKFEEDYICI